MTRFPVYQGKEVVELLKNYGFIIERQRGSHVFMKHPDGRYGRPDTCWRNDWSRSFGEDPA